MLTQYCFWNNHKFLFFFFLLLQESVEACQTLTERFTVMEKKKSELAVYLCEDANQLSLEELFGTIRTFRGLFIKALKVREDIYLTIPVITGCPRDLKKY